MSPFSWHFRGSLIAIIHGAWHLQVPMVWVHLTYPNSPPFPQMTPFTLACSPNCSQGLPTVPFIDTLCCTKPPLWDSAYTVSFFPWHMKTTEVQPSKQTDSASPLSSSPARLLHRPHPPTTRLQTKARNTVHAYEGVTERTGHMLRPYLALRS